MSCVATAHVGQAVQAKKPPGYLAETQNVIHEWILTVKREGNSGLQDRI